MLRRNNCVDVDGLNFTPRNAIGMSNGIMMALKISAERMALSELPNCITFNTLICGMAATKSAGKIAKYFEISLANENVVNAPRVINCCFPISTTANNLVGSESKSTILPASLAACVPEFIAKPISACASAGASLVPSPTIATKCPLFCSARIQFNLSSGLASAI